MSTRSPRNGTPSASRRARWRSPFASDPSARTTRCQGGRVVVRVSTVAGEPRRARRDVAVACARSPAGSRARARVPRLLDARERADAIASHDTLPRVRHGTYSIVARDPRDRASSASPCSRTGSPSARSSPGRAPGVGAVATQSIAEPAYGPRRSTSSRAARGARRRRSRACSPPTSSAASARSRSSTRAAASPCTPGRRCIAHRRPRARRRLQRPGQHDGVGRRLARDGARLRGGRRPARAPAAGRAARGRGGRAATCAAASRRRSSSRPPRASRGGGRRPARRRPPRAAGRARPPARPRRRLRPRRRRATSSRARAATRRRPTRYTRAAALAPGNHELLFWAGLSAAAGGDLPTALERVRRAIELQPGWRALLDRLEPDIAPGAPVVREALGPRVSAPADFSVVPDEVERLLGAHDRVALVLLDALGSAFLERHVDHPLVRRRRSRRCAPSSRRRPRRTSPRCTSASPCGSTASTSGTSWSRRWGA